MAFTLYSKVVTTLTLALTLDAGQFAHMVDLGVCIVKVGQQLDLHVFMIGPNN